MNCVCEKSFSDHKITAIMAIINNLTQIVLVKISYLKEAVTRNYQKTRFGNGKWVLLSHLLYSSYHRPQGKMFLLACVILFTWGGGGMMSLPIGSHVLSGGRGSKQILLIGRPPVGRPPTAVGRPLQKTDPLVGRPAGF